LTECGIKEPRAKRESMGIGGNSLLVEVIPGTKEDGCGDWRVNHLSSRTSVKEFLRVSVLDPTIFSCFINDLPSIRSEVGEFVDNCTMFSTIHNPSFTELIHVQIQQDLDNIQA